MRSPEGDWPGGDGHEFTCHLCGKVKEGADERSALLKLAFHYDRRHKGWTQSPPFLATTDASVLRESLARMTLLWQEAEAEAVRQRLAAEHATELLGMTQEQWKKAKTSYEKQIERLRDYNDELYEKVDSLGNGMALADIECERLRHLLVDPCDSIDGHNEHDIGR